MQSLKIKVCGVVWCGVYNATRSIILVLNFFIEFLFKSQLSRLQKWNINQKNKYMKQS